MREQESNLISKKEGVEKPILFLEQIRNEAAERLEEKDRESVKYCLDQLLLDCQRYAESTLAVARVASQGRFRDNVTTTKLQRVHETEHRLHNLLGNDLNILARVCQRYGLATQWYEGFFDKDGKIDRDIVGEWALLVFRDKASVAEAA